MVQMGPTGTGGCRSTRRRCQRSVTHSVGTRRKAADAPEAMGVELPSQRSGRRESHSALQRGTYPGHDRGLLLTQAVAQVGVAAI